MELLIGSLLSEKAQQMTAILKYMIFLTQAVSILKSHYHRKEKKLQNYGRHSAK